MAWIIKSIVKIMLSILDDVMAWGASLINNLELDIGNSDPKGKSSAAEDSCQNCTTVPVNGYRNS